MPPGYRLSVPTRNHRQPSHCGPRSAHRDFGVPFGAFTPWCTSVNVARDVTVVTFAHAVSASVTSAKAAMERDLFVPFTMCTQISKTEGLTMMIRRGGTVNIIVYVYSVIFVDSLLAFSSARIIEA